ncbi:MAG: Ig-like domain-containing protein [Ignavibacteriae bacterium]|nr:Ig-like domain-containing protein [Ignavibacteriota bacterium]
MKHSAIVRRLTRGRIVLAATTLLLAFIVAACDEDTPTETPWVKTVITQPLAGEVISDSTVRIIASVTRNCGCLAQAEFWIDGNHLFTDFLADYSYDWDVRGLSGEHLIVVRGIVPGKAEDSDSLRITLR